MADPHPTRRQCLLGAASLIAVSACSSRAASGCAGADQGGGRAPAPPRANLYQCEGCEGVLERPSATLPPHARMTPDGEPGEPMRIEGVVYQVDGTTPAANVVVYAYQTDSRGLYSRGTPETEWSRRHGLLRGWVKTGADGRYGFDTIKPGPYPNSTMPAHVHLTVLEPGRTAYYIDDIVFDGEFGVTEAYRARMEYRGGNGIVRLARDGGTLVARRDIVLERHPA